jgi:hypothetical protein
MTQGANLISWRDYSGVDGFAATTADDLNELRKALVAGQDVNAPAVGPGVGFPMRVESLEQTLKNTTFSSDHIEFWKMIPKLGATNTVEEYNQLQDYGQLDLGAFINEGDLPGETDSTYERKFSIVKYLGTTRRVTHVMSIIKPAHGNQVAQEAINGTLYLLQRIERSLFYADSSLDPVQWDGFEKRIRDDAPANVIDLRGKPLTESVLHDAALKAYDAPNYGRPSHLFLNPTAHNDLVKTFFPKGRYELLTKGDEGMVGLNVRGYTSPAGRIRFVPDVFIDDGGGIGNVVAIGDVSKRPGTPSITQAIAAAGAGSQFGANDAGDYFYHVVAVSSKGQSIGVQVDAAAVTVATGNSVTFGVTPAPGLPLPTFYKVYRTKRGGAAGTARLILRVANSAGAGQLVITDSNANLPGTTIAFLFQLDSTNMSFKQLAPLVKVPLATIDSSIRFMMLFYGTPELYTPRHNVLITNIGRDPDAVGV